MNILSVAYPFAAVGPAAVGGAEQVLAQIDRGLVRAGHRSVVIAAEGSAVCGELIAVPLPPGTVDDDVRAVTHELWRAAIRDAIQQSDIDVVHLHGVDFHRYTPSGLPVVATLHLPISFYPAADLCAIAANTYLVCVSQNQRRSCPPMLEIAEVIENGVELDDTVESVSPGCRYALAMGRICPEKGFHLAVDAAEQAGVPLFLAGQVFPYAEHVRYFEQVLEPRLKPPHRFLGPLGPAQKQAWLGGARCLLAPSLVAETSSLVTMEALSAGTPVVAFPSGALADLIEDSRTGFIVHDTTEMAAAIRRAGEISRDGCRQVARERFSAARMTAQYLDLYERLSRESFQTTACRRAISAYQPLR